MSRRSRILGIGLAALAALVGGGMAVLSYDASCADTDRVEVEAPVGGPAGGGPVANGSGAGAPDANGSASMLRVARRCYGSSAVLKLESVPVPVAGDGEVLVRVRAASINPQEWHYTHGKPYIMRLSAGVGRPEDPRLGVDFAGTVAAVGRNVTRFRPGDDVFGARTGAFAEYITVRADRIIEPKPAKVSFEEAAAVGVAATTALQAVRDHGRVRPGQRVLINGASGGVGTYAVQIAKAWGADVTGVTSTRNVELVRSLGADRVVDYTQEDFTAGAERYDVIIDMVGNHGLRRMRRVLRPDGAVVVVGGPKSDPWLGPVARAVSATVYSRFVSQRFVAFIADFTVDDIATLRELLESGRMRSVIDRRFSLAQVPEAMDYLGTGRTRGKNVIVMSGDVANAPRLDTAGRVP